MESLSINDPQPLMLRKVSMWHHESNAIEIVSPVFDDITVPLTHAKGLLRTAIDDVKLSDYLIISSKQAEQIAFIVDQLLAHSHLAAAASLLQGSQLSATAKHGLVTPYGMNTFGTTAQVLYSQSRTDIVPIERPLNRKHFVNGLRTTQNLSKTTPWGTIQAEIHLIGGRLYSEILCFRVSFTPDRRLSDIGVVIDYASHYIKSLVGVNRPLCQLTNPRTVITFIDFAMGLTVHRLPDTFAPADLFTEQTTTYHVRMTRYEFGQLCGLMMEAMPTGRLKRWEVPKGTTFKWYGSDGHSQMEGPLAFRLSWHPTASKIQLDLFLLDTLDNRHYFV